MALVKRQRTTNEVGDLINRNGNQNEDQNKTLYSDAVILEGHEGSVLATKFSKDGSRLASGGFDSKILLWNLPVDEYDDSPNYGVLSGHKSSVLAVRWYDENLLVSASADHTVGYWDHNTGTRIKKGTGHKAIVNDIDVNCDGLALSVGDDGIAFIWDQREKLPLEGVHNDYPLLSCSFSNQGNLFFVSGIDPTLRAFDIRKFTEPLWECEGQFESITSISITKDDSMLLSRSMDGVIRTYSARDFVPSGLSRLSPYTYEGAISGSEFQLIRATFSPDNINISSGSEDLTVTTWDIKSRKIINKLHGHNGTVIDVDYHPSKKILASGSTDGNIIVREIV